MKKAMLLAIVVITGFSTVLVHADGVDFSGEWILSELVPLSGAARIPHVSLVIKQTGNDLSVTRHMIDEDRTIESHYTLDGTENINIEANAAGPVTIRSISKWNNGALVLEGSSTFAGPNEDVTTKWKREYLLDDGGAVLTVTETLPTPFGEAVISRIFSRR